LYICFKPPYTRNNRPVGSDVVMDIKQKKSILSHLAQKADTAPAALQAIQKESTKISTALQSESQYDNIADQLELLDTIAYRVYEEAVGTIQDLLERLKILELTYHEIPGFSAERLREYQNNFILMVRALEVLEHIRYHQPSEILDIFFDYSCYKDEGVVKQAKHGIKKIAGYDLDIFYGDGKDWLGLGWGPQEKVLEKIASFDETQKQKYFSAIIIACEQMLAPTISGTSSTYKAVTWRTGAVPAKDGVIEIRKEALHNLQNLYSLAKNVEQRKAILNAMEAATRTPHMGEYGDDVLAMIIKNTIAVMDFMKNVAVTEDMQIMQKIEHDAYWLFYRKGSLDETIHKIALEIRDALYADKEYQKYRILIGFESVFHDWEKEGKEREDFEHERKYRETEALRLAECIDTDTYNEWKNRIISYAGTKSNDMATFPYFGKFLEHFGKNSPDLALQILSESSGKLENFIIAILCGVAETERKEDVYSLIDGWCEEGKYLFSLARFFEFSSEVNEELLKKILDKALASNHFDTLNQIISSASVQYNEYNKHLVKKFIIPALEKLTGHKNPGWVSSFWFRKQSSNILADLEVTEKKVILDNLFWLREIDYHAEEILFVIAKQAPELVIQFFCDRLSREKDEEDMGRYDAIPYSFHKLSEPLSQHPVQAVDAVLDIYDGKYGAIGYGGARLLKNIFPTFPSEFQQKLQSLIQTKNENNLGFVLAILRNYDGNPIIHNVCKELVKILPEEDSLLTETIIALESTGVVSGEYGFAEAYENKIKEIDPWLVDEDERVRSFAVNYINDLKKQVETERERSDESITLMKHQYGGDKE